MTEQITVRPRGRPRAFDETAFLDGAITLFSGAGFSGVGISSLTSETGLTVGSLYKAYGDKEGIFLHALDRYLALRETEIEALFASAATARIRIEALLRLYVALSQGLQGRLGCLVVAGLADLDQVGKAADTLRAQLDRRRDMLAELIEEGRRDGSVAAGPDPRICADLLLCLLHGMRIVGKSGTLTDDDDAFVHQALKLLD